MGVVYFTELLVQHSLLDILDLRMLYYSKKMSSLYSDWESLIKSYFNGFCGT